MISIGETSGVLSVDTFVCLLRMPSGKFRVYNGTNVMRVFDVQETAYACAVKILVEDTLRELAEAKDLISEINLSPEAQEFVNELAKASSSGLQQSGHSGCSITSLSDVESGS